MGRQHSFWSETFFRGHRGLSKVEERGHMGLRHRKIFTTSSGIKLICNTKPQRHDQNDRLEFLLSDMIPIRLASAIFSFFSLFRLHVAPISVMSALAIGHWKIAFFEFTTMLFGLLQSMSLLTCHLVRGTNVVNEHALLKSKLILNVYIHENGFDDICTNESPKTVVILHNSLSFSSSP